MGHEEFGISFDKGDYPEIKTLKIVGDPLNGRTAALSVPSSQPREGTA